MRHGQISMREAEILVIGGGIAGASAAYHLAAYGRRVTLLERGEVASGASGVNAGAIDSTGWGDQPDLQAHLTAGSLELFKLVHLDLGEDIGLRQSGALQVIQTLEQYEFVHERVRDLRARGHRVELLTARQARSIEPALAPSLLGAMYSPLRSQADPGRATRAFATLAERRGARVLTHHEVTALERRAAGGYVIRTSQGDFIAGTLVIAAGGWCARIGAMLDLDIPIVPVRGQMWATASVPPRIFQTISSAESSLAWYREQDGDPHPAGDRGPHPDEGRDPHPDGGRGSAGDRGGEPPDLTHRKGARATRHLYGRQRRDGEIIFGGDREPVGRETTSNQAEPDPAGIAINRAHAAEVLPFLAGLAITRSWAGLMPFTLDGKPLIGRIPCRENLWIVSGLASSGFGRGPMAGKLLADYIHTGQGLPELAEADPARCVRELARPR